MIKRRWTTAEDAILRAQYGRVWNWELGARLGRTGRAVGERAHHLGLTRNPSAEVGPEFHAYIREKHAAGWSDCDIAKGWGCDTATVLSHRHKLGLPSLRFNARHRAKIAAGHKRKMLRAGFDSLSELRHAKERAEAMAAGWPPGTGLAERKILEALEAGGRLNKAHLRARGVDPRTIVSLVAGGVVRNVKIPGVRPRVFELAIQRRYVPREDAA